MKYIVVVALDLNELEESVNGYIQQGWRPQGGVCMSPQNSRLLQAMIIE